MENELLKVELIKSICRLKEKIIELKLQVDDVYTDDEASNTCGLQEEIDKFWAEYNNLILNEGQKAIE